MQKLIILVVAASTLVNCVPVWNRQQLFPGSMDQMNQNLEMQYELPLVKRNRLCLLNAGLSQGCDLSDIIMAKQQVHFTRLSRRMLLYRQANS